MAHPVLAYFLVGPVANDRGRCPRTPGILRISPAAWLKSKATTPMPLDCCGRSGCLPAQPCPAQHGVRRAGNGRRQQGASRTPFSCYWPKATNPMNWSPARGMYVFSEHFFILQCIVFRSAPSPVVEGARGKRCFRFSYSPTAGGLRSYSYSSRGRHMRLPTEESSYSARRRPQDRRQFIAQDTLGIRPAIGSVIPRASAIHWRYRIV
jgi:hypothetical protein